MILVGARFRALAGARAALRAVRASVRVVPGDVGVRPLGTTRYDSPIEDFLLAGRFEPGDVESVIRILHAHGGRGRRSAPRQLAGRDVGAAGPTRRDIRSAAPERCRPPGRGTLPCVDPRAAPNAAAPSLTAAAGPDGAEPSHRGLTVST